MATGEGDRLPPEIRLLRARAHFLGAHLDLSRIETERHLVRRPLLLPVATGWAALFRYGAVVTFQLDRAAEDGFLASLTPYLSGAVPTPEVEEAVIEVRPGGERLQPDGTLVLNDTTPERLLVVAEVLAKSTALAHFEGRVSEAFDRIEPLAEALRSGRRPRTTVRGLVTHLGDALLTQTRTVGGAEVGEKPEITWDRPDLDRLFERLRAEYELVERDEALTRKVELITSVSGALIDLVQERQTLRVEWYIVILILIEIGLVLWQMATSG